jgi:Protein of unknown function (DUF3558)
VLAGTTGRSASLLALAVGVAAIAGCGSVSGQPESGAASSTTPSMNLYGAPHVANPLEIDKYVRNPCSVLSTQQVRQLSSSISMATKGKARATPGGRTCSYQSPDDFSLQSGSLGFITTGGGLSTIYANRANLAVFTVLPPIEGYPAVINAPEDNTKHGDCSLSVGVSDQAIAQIDFFVSDFGNKPANYTTPCVPAKKLARAAVQSMKGGS